MSETHYNPTMLIINADDWGRSVSETDAALACYEKGRITSVSAMVFMEDSQRAATLALDGCLDVGLHVNLSEQFKRELSSPDLDKEHGKIVRFLKKSKYSQLLYNPFLRREFQSCFRAQLAEFFRLYGGAPSHIDGHQHMHLSANMRFDKIIPKGEKVRRNFSFWPGEKSILNRSYRYFIDRRLVRRYRTTDYFFSLNRCLIEGSIQRVAELAKGARVELMAHPALREERDFLMSERFSAIFGGVPTMNYSEL